MKILTLPQSEHICSFLQTGTHIFWQILHMFTVTGLRCFSNTVKFLKSTQCLNIRIICLGIICLENVPYYSQVFSQEYIIFPSFFVLRDIMKTGVKLINCEAILKDSN